MNIPLRDSVVKQSRRSGVHTVRKVRRFFQACIKSFSGRLNILSGLTTNLLCTEDVHSITVSFVPQVVSVYRKDSIADIEGTALMRYLSGEDFRDHYGHAVFEATRHGDAHAVCTGPVDGDVADTVA